MSPAKENPARVGDRDDAKPGPREDPIGEHRFRFAAPQNEMHRAVTAAAITKALGGYVSASGWYRAPCPVHGSSGDSLALRDGDRRVILHCHAGCPEAEVREEIERLGVDDAALPPAIEKIRRCSRRATAVNIWETSHLAGATTQIGVYLATRLILIEPPLSIRLHSTWGPYGLHPPSGERRPQMIGAVKRVGEEGIVAVSRTFLAIDGSGKATVKPARMFCGDVKGGAVRLGKPRSGEWLVVAEGIETTLAVMQATELIAWAALSAPGLASLVLPPEVDKVLVAADHDENGIGLKAGVQAIARFRAEGRKAELLMSPIVGTDWNSRELMAAYWERQNDVGKGL
jgi:putative DNA primase/helicase